MPTLFEIADDLLALVALCDERDGDIDDPDAIAAVEAWFAELEKNQVAKLDGYIGLIRTWEMEEASAKAEAERWAKKAQVRGNRIARLKARLKEYLVATGQDKVTTAAGRTVALQKNGGVLPIGPAGWETTFSLDEYPQFAKKVPDTAAVRAALDNGAKLPFAEFGERGSHVRFR